jgi:hypothetical protein
MVMTSFLSPISIRAPLISRWMERKKRKKEIFIENRYSIQIRAGCNILPGAAAPETPPLSG